LFNKLRPQTYNKKNVLAIHPMDFFTKFGHLKLNRYEELFITLDSLPVGRIVWQ